MLWCLNAWGAIAFVNESGAANGSGSCPVTLSVTAGNTVVAIVSSNSTTSTQSVINTNSDSFTLALAQFTTGAVVTSVYTSHVGTTNASEVYTFTNSNTAQFESCAVLQYSGVASSSPVDQTATGTYSATTSILTGTTATTTQASEMAVGIFACTGVGGGLITAGGAYTVREDTNANGTSAVFVEDLVLSSTGTQQATATASGTGATGAGIIITLVPPGAGGSKPNAHATIF